MFKMPSNPKFVQKQPPEMFVIKRCCLKFSKMHKKTTVPEPFFIKKKDSGTGFFLRIFVNFLRTDFFYRALLVAAFQSYNLT